MIKLFLVCIYFMVGVVTIIPIENLCNKQMSAASKFIHVWSWPMPMAIKTFEGDICVPARFSTD